MKGIDYNCVTNNGNDVNVSMISGCKSTSLDWCESNCRKYYGCHTVAIANDLLVEYEERIK